MFGSFRRASLITQVTVVLLAGVLVAQFYPLLIHVLIPDASRMLPAPKTLAIKIEAMRDVLADASPEDRRQIMVAIQSPFMRVEVLDRDQLAALEPDFAPIRTAFARAIHDLGPNYRIATTEDPSPGMMIADLGDGSYMIAEPIPPGRSGIVMFRLGGWALFLVLAISVTLYGLLRLLAPLRTLSTAAERVGADLNVPHLTVDGPLEVRRTTQAFNRMVDRVRGLVVNRSLMMASISHDLRTMLTRLRLRIESIPDDTQRLKAVDDIEAMRRTLEANIAFARSEMPNQTTEPVDLNRMLPQVADRFSERDATIDVIADPDLVIETAGAPLDRAITNLVDNATKYGQRVRLSATRDGGTTVIVVEDDGPGIPVDQRAAVLEPFYRLDKARGRDTGGDGLGLAIADAIFRNLGGTLVIEDAQPHGTAIVVRLPDPSGKAPQPPAA